MLVQVTTAGASREARGTPRKKDGLEDDGDRPGTHDLRGST